MKFEDINSDKFSKFEGHSVSNLQNLVGGEWLITEDWHHITGEVDRYSTGAASGNGDGIEEHTQNKDDHWV